MRLLYSIILIVIGSAIGAYGAILLKQGADTMHIKLAKSLLNKYFIGGFLLYGIGTACYILALRGGELSLLYPLISTTYIWTAIFSRSILGEKINRFKWIGITLILIGVSLIGIGTR